MRIDHRLSLRASGAAATLLLVLILPVLACRKAAQVNESSAGKAAGAKPKILFYRHPMNPAITSSTPQKDGMGMDYLPVYAKEGARPMSAPGTVPGLAAVTVPDGVLRLSGVTTELAVRDTLGSSVRTSGIVVPDETRIRHVHTKISGWIEKLYVSASGQRVRAGQPLLTIYSPELLATQEEYLRAKETAARFSTSSLPEVRRGGEGLLEAARRRLELFDVPPSCSSGSIARASHSAPSPSSHRSPATPPPRRSSRGNRSIRQRSYSLSPTCRGCGSRPTISNPRLRRSTSGNRPGSSSLTTQA